MNSEKFEQTVQGAIESEPLKSLELKLLGIGADKIVFATPGSDRKVIKVDIEEVVKNIMVLLGVRANNDESRSSLKSRIAEHRDIEEDLTEVFGNEHLLRNGVFRTKIPITKGTALKLFRGGRGFEIVRPFLEKYQDDHVFEVETLIETQVLAEELKDPEKYKTKDFTTDLMTGDKFSRAKDIPKAMALVRKFIDKNFLDYFPEKFPDQKEVEIVKEILEKIIQFTKRTGLMIDVFGPNNITIFTKEDGSLGYHLPDVILPGPRSAWDKNIKDDSDFDLLRHYYTYYYSISSLADRLGIDNNLQPEDLVYFKGTGLPTGGHFPDPAKLKLDRQNEVLRYKAEISLQKAKEVILQNIPNEEIMAIYVKGSYAQGELQPDSDVDVVVILKTEKYLPKVYTLDADVSSPEEIPFAIVAYTLSELQTGGKASNRTKVTSPVSAFVKQLDHLPIIYGTKPEGNLFTRTDKKDLTAHLGAFRSTFLPDYAAGKFYIKELVKQVLWLADREQRVLGNAQGYSWQGLTDSVEDKNHIIHLALKLRRQAEVSLEESTAFVQKLEEYLTYLENTYK